MESVLLTEEEQIITISLNEPETLNVLSPSIKSTFIKILTEISKRSDIKAVIIRGKGKSFCAGGDLNSMQSLKTPTDIEKNMEYTVNIIKNIFYMDKPVITCVHGYSAGAGVSLALASDLIIAEKNAKFKLGFKNVGLVPDLGLHYFLLQALGPWKTKQLIWQGATLSAKDAFEMGIVNQVTDDGEGYKNALQLAKELVSGPRLAINKTKKLINRYSSEQLEEVLTMETYSHIVLRSTHDHQEGIKAFFEKRKPRFSD